MGYKMCKDNKKEKINHKGVEDSGYKGEQKYQKEMRNA